MPVDPHFESVLLTSRALPWSVRFIKWLWIFIAVFNVWCPYFGWEVVSLSENWRKVSKIHDFMWIVLNFHAQFCERYPRMNSVFVCTSSVCFIIDISFCIYYRSFPLHADISPWCPFRITILPFLTFIQWLGSFGARLILFRSLFKTICLNIKCQPLMNANVMQSCSNIWYFQNV